MYIFYSTMATPRNEQQVVDAHLLDNDDDLSIFGGDDDEFDVPSTPHRGKPIHMDKPSPKDMPKTPPTTPPPSSSPTMTPAQSGLNRFGLPIGPHSTKLEIYIRTTRSLQLMLLKSVTHNCSAGFFNQRQALHKILNRARTLVMQQEPYHTLMEEGYDFQLKKPQLSYKVLAEQEQKLYDVIIDPETMPFNSAACDNPLPFFEQHGKRYVSQTDVSFEFNIETRHTPVRTQTTNQGTSTYDETLLSPIIDSIRIAAPHWPKVQSTSALIAATLSGPSRITLASAGPPRHPPSTSQQARDRHQRPRPHQRLGPPVPRSFDRSRSREHK